MNFFSTSNKKPQDNKAEPAAAAEAEAQATEQQTTEDATATMNPAEIEQLKTELEAAKAAEADLKVQSQPRIAQHGRDLLPRRLDTRI